MGTIETILSDEGGHVILGGFIVWALAMVRRILARTLQLDARNEQLAARIDRVDRRVDAVTARITALHPDGSDPSPGSDEVD